MKNKKQAKGLEGIIPQSWIGDMVCPLPDVNHQDKMGNWGYLARISPTRVELIDGNYLEHSEAGRQVGFRATINLTKALKIARKNGLAQTYYLKYAGGFFREIPETETPKFYEIWCYERKGNRLVRKDESYPGFRGKNTLIEVEDFEERDRLNASCKK